MTPRAFLALALLILPIVGLLLLWVRMIRGTIRQHQEYAAMREELLARPHTKSISIYLNKGDAEHFVFIACTPAIFLTPFVLAESQSPYRTLWLMAVLLGSLWWACAGLWQYGWSTRKAPLLSLTAEGLQFLNHVHVPWRDVTDLEVRREGAGAYARTLLVLTLRPGSVRLLRKKGGRFLRALDWQQNVTGRSQIVLRIEVLEGWATPAAVLALAKQRWQAAVPAPAKPAG